MASNSDRNSGGAMHDSGYGQQQFRRTTGKVAANGGAYQSQQHPQQQQQQPPMYYAPMQATYANQQQYQAPYPLGVVSAQQYGQLNSAIPAPHDFKLQNPALAAHLQYANQRPQQQMMMGAPVAGYAQRPMAPSVYYTMPYAPQQQRNGAGPGGYTDDSSDSLIFTPSIGREQSSKTNPRQQIRLSQQLYTNTPSDSTEAANATVSASMLADDFERMGMGSRPTTAGGAGTNGHSGANKMLSNAQRQAIPVPRRREQDLEDEYDNDDGSAGGDIDASLFPSNPSQMAHMGRSEKYGSAAPAANNARTNTSSSQMSLASTQLLSRALLRQHHAAPASRNASPHNSMIPAEIAGLQRGFGTQSSLDSSARPVQQLQQQGQQQFQHPPHSGFHTDPRDRNMVPRNGPPFGQAHPGQPGLGPIQGPGQARGCPYNSSNSNTAIASNYSRSGSGEAAACPSQECSPAGMQPWNGSNKSLPGAVGPSQLAGRNAPDSGSNSTMGAAPMTAAPSARNAPMSSPAQAPPPTVSSLEAYRVSIKRSSDPAAQLEFAKYVLEHARGLADQEQTAELQQKRYSTLTAEGLKWIKKLAGSGITVHRSNIAAEAQFFLGTINVPAMYKLGVILIKGLLGVSAAPPDNATPECPHSLHELALCHEASDIPGIIPDEAYAVELYTNAAKLGYVPSQVRLGQAYEYGTLGCEVIPRKSIGWYTRAAEKGDPDAELALSGWYLTGAEPFLPQNDVEAYLWARRAADRRLAKAEYAVGYYYECGIGVARPDVEEAQKWYNRAALQENRRAIARLKELKLMGINNAPMNSAQRPRRGKGGTMF
ncbi:hypothetical protein BX661DRAFT_177626 [Kickxella alabastrina]|uniref:uncharacterized protein n=1 Tax=Kickxella alabastrina TaxID=61397 RepID=UPI002220A29E|nr:uncharacterized protein BX661DRAFT_177626 [Kickxella alabastrina]KAI7833828.1 hypothetical protein BX661DRAFT_177626 [Kickxella alabastrina]